MGLFKKRTKEDVVAKQAFSLGNKADGTPAKSGTVVTFKDGDKKTLLNPSGKGAKFAQELSLNMKFTNDGEAKLNKDGGVICLTSEERAYRAGFLDAQKASAKAYNAKAAAKKKSD